VIVDLIGFGIVMPVLPFYADVYGASGTVLGLIFAVYALAQFAFAPVWGRLSDRVGRRPVMLCTVAGTALALLALGLADSLAWIFAARILGGAFAANVSVASAYIADVTEDDERTRWMGMLGASFGVGFILGPAIGGALAPYGYAVPMLAAAALAALNLLFGAFALQEPERHHSEGEGRATRIGVLRDPLIRRLCLANLVFAVAVTQLETIFAYFMMHRFGYDARQVAWILVLMAVVTGGVQGGGMRALAARYPERLLVTVGSLMLGGAFLVVPEIPTVPLLVVALVVSALGRAVVQPSMMSLVSLAATPQNRGTVMGTFQSSASFARVVGPVAAGWLYDLSAAAPFQLAGVLLLLLALLGRTLPSREVAEPV
jgi:MFS family permease